MKALKFLELKSLVESKTKKEAWCFSKFPTGIPKGAITEICGQGKTEFILQFLAEQPTLNVAWIEENFSIFPFGVSQRKIRLQRILFVDAREELEWVTLQVLRAQVFPLVILYGEDFDSQALRRIQLAAEKSDAAAIWLSPEPHDHFAISLQVQLQKTSEGFSAEIIRKKF